MPVGLHRHVFETYLGLHRHISEKILEDPSSLLCGSLAGLQQVCTVCALYSVVSQNSGTPI